VYVPHVAVAVGRFAAGMDYGAPRSLFDKLPDYAKRGTWAHQNAFEGFGLFAAACLMVYVSGHYTPYAGTLALAHVGLRLGHSGFYIFNIPWARSLCWAGLMYCIAQLMALSFGS
jgi:uncharacterized MAPEG superfamily protein